GRFRLIVDGWATFNPRACAPPRRVLEDAVSPSTIRLKRASTIAEIRSGASVERDRVLSTSELEGLASALPASGLTDRTVAGVWLVLATGVRAGELLGATWCGSDFDLAELKSAADASAVKLGVVDLTAGRWHILETKNQRSHTIHLSDYAVKQFERLAQFREAIPGDPNQPSPWVFPNASGTGPVGVKSFGKQLADRQRPPERRLKHRSRDTEALLLPGGRWTAHDLRRTAATLMAELGFGGDIIDECLNHMIESRVRRVYVRDRRVADQARAFNALGARLEVLSAGARAEPARTVPRARRRANPARAQRNDIGVTIR
ncbi:MAG: tyrosine-type recombinase/integrase, partial [Rubrivivax sp.]|nr:tyrosine-type recombinase/integrase [Rubrivivax sp.]